MPGHEPFSRTRDPTTIEDERFDFVFPERIRRLSSAFWTPVHIAAEAAKMLVTRPRARVLDIGCGPGKFCLVGSAVTDGQFTGVEQRGELVLVAREAAAKLQMERVEFLHANITDVAFNGYGAFYIFNPFEENLFQGRKIGSDVPLSPTLFKRYARYVAKELGGRPIGTRVVTYMGYGDEVPSCYTCESARFDEDLKLWIKTREYDPDLEQLAPSRSYRGSLGWVAPRGSSGGDF